MSTELLIEQAPQLAPPVGNAASDSQTASRDVAVQRMFEYAELTGLPFFCVDVSEGSVRGVTEEGYIALLPAKILNWLERVSGPQVLEIPSGLVFYAVPLPDVHGAKRLAVGYALRDASSRPSDVALMAKERGWSQEDLDEWLSKQKPCHPTVLKQLLRLAADHSEASQREAAWVQEVDLLSEQISRTFEEISLLHDLARNLHISRSPKELAELCLDRMQALIDASGHAISLKCGEEQSHLLIEGDVPLSEAAMERLTTRCAIDWPAIPVVKNNLRETALGEEFPELENFVLVSIAEGEHTYGWILSCNMYDGREFGTVEASLMNSLATILGTHTRNIDLYQQHKDLIFCFIRSLVSAIDARDPYTRGHSERVALVARLLGVEMGLSHEDVQNLYQSGLLHDLGKVGIDDAVLRKEGKLTDEEFHHIQEHPMIGHSILSGLRNLQHLIPGVRHHHEYFSGNGYPDGLSGEDIPLMARIISVADAYDAMRSDRPYRKGMPPERVEEIFRKGAGSQWDAAVIDAYFAARDDIGQICTDYSPENLIQRAHSAS